WPAEEKRMSRLLIEGRWVDGEAVKQTLHAKFDDQVYGSMAVASPAQVDAAISDALRAVRECPVTPYDVYRILMETSRIIDSRARHFIELLRDEAGFT